MRTIGAERSLELFPVANWVSVDAERKVEGDYPGFRPAGSWELQPSGELRGLDPDGDRWCDRATGRVVDLSSRILVLAYGSNPDPGKLLSRPEFFGGDSVIALRSAVVGWAAVWCDARRGSDGSVVATLTRVPGRVEVHPVLALTAHQLTEMDRWEGHPRWYHRTPHSGVVVLESDQCASDVQVYLGTPDRRPVLIVDGRPLLCSDVPHAAVDHLVMP